MIERTEAIRRRLRDVQSVHSYVLELVERYRDNPDVLAFAPVNELLIRTERVLQDHGARLKTLAEDRGAGTEVWKDAVTSAIGVAAGLYDKLREQTLPRMLQASYIALSHLAMTYTAMHAFGLSIKEQGISTTAHDCLKEITPLVVAISRQIPEVVVMTTSEFVTGADATVGAVSLEQTQRAWEPAVTSTM